MAVNGTARTGLSAFEGNGTVMIPRIPEHDDIEVALATSSQEVRMTRRRGGDFSAAASHSLAQRGTHSRRSKSCAFFV